MTLEVQQQETIDQVIVRMERVLERCLREKSRLGYFAALYLDVTLQVRAGILAGRFEDGPRMERLDVTFASRYLTAIEQYWRGEPPTRSWMVAFRNAALTRPIILQHLLLGMNAHINLDLAIAAAQTAPGAQLPALERDFQQITAMLNAMIADVQDRIERVSPWFRVIDRVSGRTDDRIVGYSIRGARDLAWQAAERLAVAPPGRFAFEVALHDQIVATLARGISAPGPLISSGLQIIRVREVGNVPAVISALRTK